MVGLMFAWPRGPNVQALLQRWLLQELVTTVNERTKSELESGGGPPPFPDPSATPEAAGSDEDAAKTMRATLREFEANLRGHVWRRPRAALRTLDSSHRVAEKKARRQDSVPRGPTTAFQKKRAQRKERVDGAGYRIAAPASFNVP